MFASLLDKCYGMFSKVTIILVIFIIIIIMFIIFKSSLNFCSLNFHLKALSKESFCSVFFFERRFLNNPCFHSAKSSSVTLGLYSLCVLVYSVCLASQAPQQCNQKLGQPLPITTSMLSFTKCYCQFLSLETLYHIL